MRRLHVVVVLRQARLPLRGLATQEAVEVLKSIAVRPMALGSHGRCLDGRRVVPLAEGGGVVAVLFKDFGDGRRRLGHDAGVAVESDGAFGNRTGSDPRVVASGQKRCPRRRADRGYSGTVGIRGQTTIVLISRERSLGYVRSLFASAMDAPRRIDRQLEQRPFRRQCLVAKSWRNGMDAFHL